jgi:hypothetical protein
MAPQTRLIPSIPTRIMPPAPRPLPQGTFVTALMALIALVPLCAVAGYVIAGLAGRDWVPFTLVGALVGVLFSWWRRKG